MLTVEEGAFLVKTARMTFFEYLGDKSTSNPSKPPPARLHEKMGAYVRVGIFPEKAPQGLVLGFTGYPMPHKSAYQSVRDASIAIAIRTPRPPPHESKVFFEVTILSSPESLSAMRPSDVVSAIDFGRDAVMITSGLAKSIILPQTAVTKCQDAAGLLAEVCMGAGLMADAWAISPEVDLLRFRTQIFRENGASGNAVEVSMRDQSRNIQLDQS
jgi:uncharacterized protein (TIGR00296 family)